MFSDWAKWFNTAVIIALIGWTVAGIWWGATLTAQVHANDDVIRTMGAQVDWIYHYLLEKK